MNSTSNEYHEQGNSKDKLSELPDKLLVHILSFLPIKDAVATVLLRRFGNLWTLIHTLKFDESNDEQFVCNVMKFHKNPIIENFELLNIHKLSQKIFDDLTSIALSKQTKGLSAASYDYDSGFSLHFPPRVFTNENIVSLRMHNMVVDCLSEVVCMSSLRKLELVHVEISDDTLKGVIFGCPCLQELVIKHPKNLVHFQFTAPNVEKLELDLCVCKRIGMEDRFYTLDCPNLKVLLVKEARVEDLELIDVSSVREARFIECCQLLKFGCRFDGLIKKFRNAEILKLDDDVYMQLKPCGNEKLVYRENKWIRLAVSLGIHGSCLLDVIRLLRSSNKCLRKFIVYANVDLFCDCNVLMHELSSPCVMEHLKVFIIREYQKPCKALLQLIEFVLKSASVLVELVIEFNETDKLYSAEGQQFVSQLLSFPSASPKAKVAMQLMFSN